MLRGKVGVAVSSVISALVVALSSACGSSPTPGALASSTPTPTPIPVVSPTPDAATQKYVALIKSYWVQIQAADEATATTNVAARVCLGKVSAGAPNDLQFVDPAKCRERMVVSLPVHERFLRALQTTEAPPQFSADDQAFRTQLPKGIAHLKSLISVTATGSKDAVLQAALTYVGDFFPLVIDALNDVDPSVVHN
jgi:hypothetical protein